VDNLLKGSQFTWLQDYHTWNIYLFQVSILWKKFVVISHGVESPHLVCAQFLGVAPCEQALESMNLLVNLSTQALPSGLCGRYDVVGNRRVGHIDAVLCSVLRLLCGL
jgi:hypothetical protein